MGTADFVPTVLETSVGRTRTPISASLAGAEDSDQATDQATARRHAPNANADLSIKSDTPAPRCHETTRLAPAAKTPR
jgi:hypothetical protein